MLLLRSVSILLVCLIGQLHAQEKSLFDDLYSLDSVSLIITTDTRKLWNGRDDVYQAAKIEIIGDQNEMVFSCNGEVRTRGNSRKEICENPPTKIRFDKKELKNKGYATYKTMKIVNPCHDNKIYQDLVAIEYSIYKLYNTLSEKSFRVRAATVTYKDERGKKKDEQAHCFLIEHENQLADRLNGKIFEVSIAPERIFERETYLTFSLFQYFIGNTDWSVVKQHNCKYIKNDSAKEIYPIPYDFDYSGMANAEYAVPAEELNLSNVTQRLYRGPCMTDDELQLVVGHFIDHKREVMNIIEEMDLHQAKGKFCLKYSNAFYDLLENPKKIRKVVDDCPTD